MRAWLPNPKLDPRTREELLAMLEAPSPAGGTARGRLEELCRKQGVPASSTVLNLLIQVDLSEEEASRHWESLCSHREELAERLRKFVAEEDRLFCALPHDLKTVVLLFEYEDLSYEEIAGVLECSAKAVETRLYRARKILREKLEKLVLR